MLMTRRLWRAPDAGNPPVRFGEGGGQAAVIALQASHPVLPSLLYAYPSARSAGRDGGESHG